MRKEDDIQYIVYKTINLVNGKIYIGVHATETPYEFDGYFGSSKHLTNSRNKYGDENFIRETLFVFSTSEEAYAKEAEVVNIEFVNSKDTYNLKIGGFGSMKGELCPNYGRHLSEETKKKMSDSTKGVNHPFYGKKLTAEHRKNISKVRKGKTYAELGFVFKDETREKIRQSKLGSKNPNFGKTPSLETRIKLSIAGKNRKLSKETRDKISKANTGNYKLSKAVHKQRLKDVLEIPKIRGWKTKLCIKWKLTRNAISAVDAFIERFCKDIDIYEFPKEEKKCQITQDV